MVLGAVTSYSLVALGDAEAELRFRRGPPQQHGNGNVHASAMLC